MIDRRPEIVVAGKFIETIVSVIPSSIALANLSVDLDNAVSETVNEANRKAGNILTVTHDRSPTSITLRSSSDTLYRLSDNDEDYVNSYLSVVGKVIDNVVATIPQYRTRLDKAEVQEESEVKLRSTLEPISTYFGLLDSIHIEFAKAPENEVHRLAGVLVHEIEPKSDEEYVFSGLISSLSRSSRVNIDQPVEQLLTGYRERDYDADIALEALEDSDLERKVPVIRSLSNFAISCLQGLGQGVSEPQIDSFLRAGFISMNGAGSQELSRLRDQIISRILKVKTATEATTSSKIRTKDTALKYLELAYEAHLYVLMRNIISRKEAPLVEKRKRRLMIEATDIEKGDSSELRAIEPKNIQRKVSGAIWQGDTFVTSEEEDENALEEMIDEYVDSHIGTPKLKEDLNQAIAAICKADFSKVVHGVKGMTYPVNVNGSPSTLFQLKPTDFKGLPKHSKVVAQTRILFTMDGDKSVQIIKILDRDEANRFQQNNNLGSKRKG